jgi:tetratricopeptide (TPR) repeat protein
MVVKHPDIAPFFRSIALAGILFSVGAAPSLGAPGCLEAAGKDIVPLCTQDIASGRFADKNLAGLFIKRASAYLDGEQYDLAAADAGEAIRLDPANSGPFLMRGNINLLEKRYTAALKDFDQAIRIDPQNPAHYESRGMAYQLMGDGIRAMTDYNEAIRIDPDDANAVRLRADLPGSPYAPVLSPAALALIAPIHDAFARVEAAQAALPAPKSDRERLERMFDLDQVGRMEIGKIDFGTLPSDEKIAAIGAAWKEITAHDQADQAALKAMIPPEGWFTKSKYGAKASKAAFLIVQHSDEAFMRATLVKLEPLAAAGEVDGSDFALMYDRVAVFYDKRPQRYGSQVTCKSGHWQPLEIEDPAHVNDRRTAIGMPTTLEENMKRFSDMPCN